MKIYGKQNVWDESLDRIEWLFNEFDNVCVSFSGGKDSTIVLELTLMVARKLNRLPVKVFFLDQEAEWAMTIEYVERVMARDEVESYWIQTPLFMPNSVSQDVPFLIAWEPGMDDLWIHPKNPLAYQGEFKLIPDGATSPQKGYWYNYFIDSAQNVFGDESGVFLGGMRAQESPSRAAGLSTDLTYKDVTWGKRLNQKKGHYSFYPIYDWQISDVWKAIHSNQWDYCKIYDEFYRYGLPPVKMRVSNLTHESAVASLWYLQEIEGKTWEKLTARLGGINQAKHLKKDDMISVSKLPPMFSDWKEYRDYLTEKLISDEAHQQMFRKAWKKQDEFFGALLDPVPLFKKQIKSVLVNDHELAKLDPFMATPIMCDYKRWKRGTQHVAPEVLEKIVKPEFLRG